MWSRLLIACLAFVSVTSEMEMEMEILAAEEEEIEKIDQHHSTYDSSLAAGWAPAKCAACSAQRSHQGPLP